jgi:hypothetical protein
VFDIMPTRSLERKSPCNLNKPSPAFQRACMDALIYKLLRN